jgi:Mitochondrial carrier protein
MIRTDTNTPEDRESLSNTNPIKEMTSILESEGPRSLFSGLLPRAVRALTSGGIQFASYELTQNALMNR